MNSLCSLSSAIIGCPSTITSSNPVMRYTFDISSFSGSNILNIASNSYEATSVNSASYYTSSYTQGNSSVRLSNTAKQCVSVNTPFSTGTYGLTFCCWFQANTSSTSCSRIFEFSSSYTKDIIAMLVNYPNVNYMYVSIFNGSTASDANTLYTTSVNDNTWRHMAWVIMPSKTNYLYINGSLASTFTTAYYPPSISRTGTLGYNSYAFISNNEYYNGCIDDFRFYNSALTASDISTIYIGTMIVEYTFDTTTFSGSNIKNVVSSNYEATTVNSATYSTSNYRQGDASLYLQSSLSQYVNVNTSFTTGTNGITFCCWFQSNSSGNYARIFEFSSGTRTDIICVFVDFGPSNNWLYVSIFSGGASGDVSTGYTTSVNDSTWRHMAWVIMPSKTNYLYINGSLASTFTTTYYPPSVSRTGYFGNNSYGNSLYNGYIDDFRIYNTPLTASQISTIYNS